MPHAHLRNYIVLFSIILLFSVTATTDNYTSNCTSENTQQESFNSAGTLVDSVGGNLLINTTSGGTNTDSIYDIERLGTNSYLFAGATYSFSAPNGDGYFGLLDSNGQLIWQDTVGGTDYDEIDAFTQAANGDFLFAGQSGSWSSGLSDAWIVRMSPDRTVVWNTSIGGGSNDYAYDIKECANGDIIFAGATYSYGAGNLDGFAGSVNSTGHLIWNETYGGSDVDTLKSLAPTDDGGFILAGYTSSFGNLSTNVYYIKIDDKGQKLWNYTFGFDDADAAYSIIPCLEGGYAIAGYTSSFGDPLGDVLLLRISNDGTVLWHQEYGGSEHEYGYDVIESMHGGFAIAGYSDSFGGADCDMYLVRTNATGHQLWENYYGGGGDERSYAVAEIPQGGFICAGRSDDYGPGGQSGYFAVVAEIRLTEGFGTHVCEYGLPVHIDLNASSKAPILNWVIDDIDLGALTYFEINSLGVISEISAVPIGTYQLRAWAYDSVDHVINDTLSIIIADSLAPSLSVSPTTQVVELGDNLDLQLSASDISGIDQWWVNDTTHFSVDYTGRVISIGDLGVDNYGVMVYVNDTNGNTLTDEFLVSVQDTTSPNWIIVPSDITMYVGQPTLISLAAYDLSGIDYYTVDSTNFEIVGTSIRNSTTLSAGTYEVTIRAYDMNGNSVTSIFDISVIEYPSATGTTIPSTIVPDIPVFYWIVTASLALVAVFLGWIVGRKK